VAAENRWADDPLALSLAKDAKMFEFFQAVHLIQASHPDAAGVGMQGPPEREVIRFQCDPSLSFPASDISSITVRDLGGEMPRYEVATTFLGIYGSASPLPVFYTEDILHADPDESLVKGFVDLFHHRLMSLFYRVWEKYRYERLFRAGGADVLSRRLMNLIGVGADVAPLRPKIPNIRLLAFAGLLSQLPRSASALRGILAEYFDPAPVAVEQFVGAFVPIAPEQRARLGVSNCTLGRDAPCGEKVYDLGATFRVRLGPVGLEPFLTFLPPGANHPRVRELTDLINADALDYQIEVVLDRAEVPELQLGAPIARLGWCSWIGGRPASDPSVTFHVKGRLHGQR
jgi:type VI secretion system protein ImpH